MRLWLTGFNTAGRQLRAYDGAFAPHCPVGPRARCSHPAHLQMLELTGEGKEVMGKGWTIRNSSHSLPWVAGNAKLHPGSAGSCMQ